MHLSACCAHAEEQLHQLALRLDRSALIKEKRSRLLQAIRQTYNDFFHNYFITGDHCFRLRVSKRHLTGPCDPLCEILMHDPAIAHTYTTLLQLPY